MNRGKPYTAQEVLHIMDRYPVASCRTIAQELGRTRLAIVQKVYAMGLKRTAKQTSAIYSTWSRRRKSECRV